VVAGNFSLHHRVQTGSVAHPASYPMGTRGCFPGGKAAGCEADHSPPSIAEVRNAWNYTSTPPIRPHGVVLNCESFSSNKLTLQSGDDMNFTCRPWPESTDTESVYQVTKLLISLNIVFMVEKDQFGPNGT
jgi:hypothetical protein